MTPTALRRNRRAFTLLELIVVLVVLGLLAAIAIPTYQMVTQRAAETAEKSSLEAVTRAAVASAAQSRDLPPTAAQFQAAFDETPSYGAVALPGLSAQEGANVAVIEEGGPVPEGADAVFVYDVQGDTAAIIGVSTSAEGRCVAAATTGTTVRSGIFAGTEYGADEAAATSEQCVPVVALNWALDTDEEVPPATTTTTTTAPAAAPATPANVVGAPNINEIALSWDPVVGAETYNVAKNDNTDTPVAEALEVANWTDTGLAEGTAYSYQVQACAAALCSDWSTATIVTTTTVPAPAAPSAPTFGAVTTNSVQVSWAAVPGAASYDVARNGTVALTSHTGTSNTFSSLTSGTTYEFEVRACGANGACSDWSDGTSTTTGGTFTVAAGSNDEWVVPAGVTEVTVKLQGGDGANGVRYENSGTAGTGGNGGSLVATIPVTPGETIALHAGAAGNGLTGGQGYGVGGSNLAGQGRQYGGGGGGDSRFSVTGDSGNARLLVAGGAGGGGSTQGYTGGNGGNGGAGTAVAGNGGAAAAGPHGGIGSTGTAPGGSRGSNGSGGAGGNGAAAAGDWVTNNGESGSTSNGGRGGGNTTHGRAAGAGGAGYGGGGGAAVTYGVVGLTRAGGGGGGGGFAGTQASVTSATTNGASVAGNARICWHGNTLCS